MSFNEMSLSHQGSIVLCQGRERRWFGEARRCEDAVMEEEIVNCEKFCLGHGQREICFGFEREGEGQWMQTREEQALTCQLQRAGSCTCLRTHRVIPTYSRTA